MLGSARIPRKTSRLWLWLALALVGGSLACSQVPRVLLAPYGPTPSAAEAWFSPTQIAFLQGLEIITNVGGRELLFRPEGSEAPWRSSPVALRRPHSVALGANGMLYVVDTHGDRILRVADLASGEVTAATEIDGKELHRPHDIVADPRGGLLYVIDGRRRLYRFRDFGVEEEHLRLGRDEIGYSRALSVVDGTLYLVSSARGQVVRVDDFEQRRLRTFTSAGKKREDNAGSWSETGLILNDIERFDGYWYGSSFFHSNYSPEQDTGKYRLIRWKTWQDFERGRWQDLSRGLPAEVVPYYFWVHRRTLYVAGLATSRKTQGGIFVVATAGAARHRGGHG